MDKGQDEKVETQTPRDIAKDLEAIFAMKNEFGKMLQALNDNSDDYFKQYDYTWVTWRKAMSVSHRTLPKVFQTLLIISSRATSGSVGSDERDNRTAQLCNLQRILRREREGAKERDKKESSSGETEESDEPETVAPRRLKRKTHQTEMVIALQHVVEVLRKKEEELERHSARVRQAELEQQMEEKEIKQERQEKLRQGTIEQQLELPQLQNVQASPPLPKHHLDTDKPQKDSIFHTLGSILSDEPIEEPQEESTRREEKKEIRPSKMKGFVNKLRDDEPPSASHASQSKKAHSAEDQEEERKVGEMLAQKFGGQEPNKSGGVGGSGGWMERTGVGGVTGVISSGVIGSSVRQSSVPQPITFAASDRWETSDTQSLRYTNWDSPPTPKRQKKWESSPNTSDSCGSDWISYVEGKRNAGERRHSAGDHKRTGSDESHSIRMASVDCIHDSGTCTDGVGEGKMRSAFSWVNDHFSNADLD
ncbi:hypothetical protein BLNAU_20839 [Blattamonas nauphoetae]|uniref:Uncharacterized protein n=1 Tax=Blattamonas nauphoetae TaxID=2049346 RepID=A0ABQ9WYN0_9EUKA|nr:hypothetical protein BLNAU_20839 [Blattamonas nauphoetae]